MIFGNKEKYAIEVSDVETINNNLFAHFMIWIGGEELGDRNQKVMLHVPFELLLDALDKNWTNQYINKLSTQEAWGYLEENSFGEGDGSTDKHNICANFCESWDGESLFLVSTEKHEKFIWKKYKSEKKKEISLPLGTYESTINDFVKWYRDRSMKI